MVQRKDDDFENSLKPVLLLDNFTSFNVDDVNEVFSLFGGVNFYGVERGHWIDSSCNV